MKRMVVRHQDLDVYKKAFDAAMQIFELSKEFPKEETYSLTEKGVPSTRNTLASTWRRSLISA